MDIIEKELLYHLITDRPFAEYITQRIEIGDFDDVVANTIYNEVVDLLFLERQISFEVMLEYFIGNESVTHALKNLAKLEI
jgi:hypothetical protein